MDTTNNLSETLSIRLSHSQMQRVKSCAGQAGLHPSEYVRVLIDLDRPEGELRDDGLSEQIEKLNAQVRDSSTDVKEHATRLANALAKRTDLLRDKMDLLSSRMFYALMALALLAFLLGYQVWNLSAPFHK